MAVSQTRAEVAYGRTSPLILLPDQTVVSTKNPTNQDKKEIGTFWVNKTNNSVFIITNIRGTSTWVALTGGTGIFSNLNVSGNLTVDGDTDIQDLQAKTATFTGTIVGATNATESISLAGGPKILTGNDVPDNAAAVNIGDLYINLIADDPANRLYIAMSIGAWTNITCAA